MSLLPTHIRINATIKNALAAGVYITVLHKGDADRGTLYVRLDDRTNPVKLYQQIFDGNQTRLVLHSEGDAVASAIDRIINIDRDIWVVEVEDRTGRLWFDETF